MDDPINLLCFTIADAAVVINYGLMVIIGSKVM